VAVSAKEFRSLHAQASGGLGKLRLVDETLVRALAVANLGYSGLLTDRRA